MQLICTWGEHGPEARTDLLQAETEADLIGCLLNDDGGTDPQAAARSTANVIEHLQALLAGSEAVYEWVRDIYEAYATPASTVVADDVDPSVSIRLPTAVFLAVLQAWHGYLLGGPGQGERVFSFDYVAN